MQTLLLHRRTRSGVWFSSIKVALPPKPLPPPPPLPPLPPWRYLLHLRGIGWRDRNPGARPCMLHNLRHHLQVIFFIFCLKLRSRVEITLTSDNLFSRHAAARPIDTVSVHFWCVPSFTGMDLQVVSILPLHCWTRIGVLHHIYGNTVEWYRTAHIYSMPPYC